MKLTRPTPKPKLTRSEQVFDLMLMGIVHNHTGMNINRPAKKAKKAARKRVQAARRANW